MARIVSFLKGAVKHKIEQNFAGFGKVGMVLESLKIGGGWHDN